jgi:hypothetical protein
MELLVIDNHFSKQLKVFFRQVCKVSIVFNNFQEGRPHRPGAGGTAVVEGGVP